MRDLYITTIIWSFSFSLIGNYLAGKFDSYYAVLIRFVIAFIVFLPFTRFKKQEFTDYAILMAIGAVQVGLMYLFFYRSFLYLPVPVVIMLTSFTPLYIGLYDSIKMRKIEVGSLRNIILAIVGAIIIRWSVPKGDFIYGLLMVQAANVCFAFGQLAYRELSKSRSWNPKKDLSLFAWFYLGAIVFVAPLTLLFGDSNQLIWELPQLLVLAWLGIVASGFGYLCWNRGSRFVSRSILAIMNNLVVPLGVVVSFFWGIQIQKYWLFGLGAILIFMALWRETKNEKTI